MMPLYRWRGVSRGGSNACGQFTAEPGEMAAMVERYYRGGYVSMLVCSGPGPVPPPAVSPADAVAGIGPHPDTGKRTWWAES